MPLNQTHILSYKPNNNERVKIGSSNPDFDPFLIVGFISIKDAGDERQGAASTRESA